MKIFDIYQHGSVGTVDRRVFVVAMRIVTNHSSLAFYVIRQ